MQCTCGKRAQRSILQLSDLTSPQLQLHPQLFFSFKLALYNNFSQRINSSKSNKGQTSCSYILVYFHCSDAVARLCEASVRLPELLGLVVDVRNVCASLYFSTTQLKAPASLSCHKRLHKCVCASMLGVTCLLVGLTFSSSSSSSPANRNSFDVLAAPCPPPLVFLPRVCECLFDG